MVEVTLGSRIFKTKQSATVEIRRVLHGAELFVNLHGKELELVSALYALHPRRKLDVVPVSFCVAINDFYGALARGFHATFDDGTVDKFSYRTCLAPGSDEPSIMAVMRGAIMLSQREVLRSVYWRIRPSLASCWRCNKFVPMETAHVHHLHPKFCDIADHFISLIGLPEVRIGVIGDTFVDKVMLNRWQSFHDSVAQRVISCAKCNAEVERDS